MASVRRFKDSQFWYACFLGADGARKQRSTRKTDRNEALSVALVYEKSARAARENRWSEDSAQRFLKELRTVANVSAGELPAIDAWLEEWLAASKPNWAPKTWTKYREIVRSFVAWMGPAACGTLSEVTPALLARYRTKLRADGLSRSTVNCALAVFNQAFREAVQIHLLERNPAEGLRLRHAKAKAQRRTPFGFEVFRRLVAATEGEWRTFLMILGYTGARQQEAAQLLWERVDFERRTVTLIRGKNHDQPHVIPMHSSLEAELRARFAASADVRVLPRLSGKKVRALSKYFRESILPKVGIVQPYREGGGASRKLAAFSLHSLRHSLSTWLEEAGATEMERMNMLGHDTIEINRRYTHGEIGRTATALARVPGL